MDTGTWLDALLTLKDNGSVPLEAFTALRSAWRLPAETKMTALDEHKEAIGDSAYLLLVGLVQKEQENQDTRRRAVYLLRRMQPATLASRHGRRPTRIDYERVKMHCAPFGIGQGRARWSEFQPGEPVCCSVHTGDLIRKTESTVVFETDTDEVFAHNMYFLGFAEDPSDD